MQKDDEYLMLNFNDKAQQLFYHIYEEFVQSVKDIDRQQHEHLFHQCQGKYAIALKQRLEQQALNFIADNRTMPTLDRFQKKVPVLIQQYILEFLQQARLL